MLRVYTFHFNWQNDLESLTNQLKGNPWVRQKILNNHIIVESMKETLRNVNYTEVPHIHVINCYFYYINNSTCKIQHTIIKKQKYKVKQPHFTQMSIPQGFQSLHDPQHWLIYSIGISLLHVYLCCSTMEHLPTLLHWKGGLSQRQTWEVLEASQEVYSIFLSQTRSAAWYGCLFCCWVWELGSLR